jgi:hypothetical protein
MTTGSRSAINFAASQRWQRGGLNLKSSDRKINIYNVQKGDRLIIPLSKQFRLHFEADSNQLDGMASLPSFIRYEKPGEGF